VMSWDMCDILVCTFFREEGGANKNKSRNKTSSRAANEAQWMLKDEKRPLVSVKRRVKGLS